MPHSQQDRVQIDLEELIEKYIWRRYKETLGYPKRLLCRRSQYCMDIKWGFADFQHATSSKVRNQAEQRDRKVKLYSTKYQNETFLEQKYNLTASRATTAATRIELQDSYTIGAETNLEVSFLGLITAGGGLNGTFSVTNTEEETFEETVTWEINTEISVPGNKVSKASVNVQEKPLIIDFTTVTVLTLPKGKLPVIVRRVKDRKEMRTFTIENLSAVFNENTGFDKLNVDLSTVTTDFDLESGYFEFDSPDTGYCEIGVRLVTHGVCRNTSFVDQRLKVKYLSDSETSSQSTESGVQNDFNSDLNTDGSQAEASSSADETNTVPTSGC